MTAALASLLLMISASSANSADGKNSIASCFVQKIVNDEEEGPKFVIGWRYRDSDRGPVAYSASDIHDPGNLLEGRSIHSVVDGPALTLFLILGDPQRQLAPLALALSKSERGGALPGGIMSTVDGSVKSIYFGNCIAKDYGSSSDAIFATLKGYGVHEFQ